MNKIHLGKCLKGKFLPNDPTSFRHAFAKLEGKPVEVIVRPPKKERSLNQNRYYFKIIVGLIAEELGYSIEEAHEVLKIKFLYDLSGDVPKVKSTTDLTTVESEEYYSQIRQWASEFLGVYVPLPNEVEY